MGKLRVDEPSVESLSSGCAHVGINHWGRVGGGVMGGGGRWVGSVGGEDGAGLARAGIKGG